MLITIGSSVLVESDDEILTEAPSLEESPEKCKMYKTKTAMAKTPVNKLFFTLNRFACKYTQIPEFDE